MKKKTFLSWSNGKDSAWALHALRQDPEIDLLGLFTVVNKAYGRVSMHATRADLMKRQADALDLALPIINCVDPRKVPAALAGRRWSKALLKEFPENVDPCGENGEFHTIVVGGPMFRESIPIHIGETVEREGFVFTDIIPEN